MGGGGCRNIIDKRGRTRGRREKKMKKENKEERRKIQVRSQHVDGFVINLNDGTQNHISIRFLSDIMQ